MHKDKQYSSDSVFTRKNGQSETGVLKMRKCYLSLSSPQRLWHRCNHMLLWLRRCQMNSRLELKPEPEKQF